MDKLLRSNGKTGDFLLQRRKHIHHENGHLPIKKGELEHIPSVTSGTSIFHNVIEWLLLRIE